MKIYAVLTGDIIKSSKIKEEQREYLLETLKETFHEINAQLLKETTPPFEFYRGDSFQMVLKQPQKALLISLIIRARLRSITEQQRKGQKNYADARISIGIGGIAYKAKKLAESDGEAFQRSGRGLDAMKSKNSLGIQTTWPEVNEELAVACALSETIINRWTVSQAEVIYPYLLENKTQKELAKQFNISQVAVSKRLAEAGNIDAIKLFIQRYEKLIGMYCNHNIQ